MSLTKQMKIEPKSWFHSARERHNFNRLPQNSRPHASNKRLDPIAACAWSALDIACALALVGLLVLILFPGRVIRIPDLDGVDG